MSDTKGSYLMSQQRTSEVAVSDGLARQIGRMAEDATRIYPGGTAKAELAKGHPEFVARYHLWLDGLADERAIALPILERPPLRIIEVGKYKKVADFRRALADAKCGVGNWANGLMERPRFQLSKPGRIVVCTATIAELGYPQGCTVAESFAALERIGAKKLPPDGMMYLRLAYLNQPLGEWLLGYMDPLADSYGRPEVFSVVHGEGGLWLGGGYARLGSTYVGGAVWAFARE